MKTFTLPISTGYVKHWDLWEAVRELLQNALDERDRDREGAMYWTHDGAWMRVGTTRGHLETRTLILGEGDKADGERGRFGEGYKLAALVLCRLGCTVRVNNGNEVWAFEIVYDETWGAEVLRVTVEDAITPSDGVCWCIAGVEPAVFDELQRNLRSNDTTDAALLEPEEKGRLYVGGLFVQTLKDFEHGYTLQPETLRLDRDRQMVSDFDLAFVTSRLWSHDTTGRALDLIDARKPDAAYVQSFASKTAPVVTLLSTKFTETHGDAVPVSTQAEVERAQAAGMKWALVPQAVQNMLRLVRSWFVPSTKSPVERLKEWRQRNLYHTLVDDSLAELDDIIACMEAKP